MQTKKMLIMWHEHFALPSCRQSPLGDRELALTWARGHAAMPYHNLGIAAPWTVSGCAHWWLCLFASSLVRIQGTSSHLERRPELSGRGCVNHAVVKRDGESKYYCCYCKDNTEYWLVSNRLISEPWQDKLRTHMLQSQSILKLDENFTCKNLHTNESATETN